MNVIEKAEAILEEMRNDPAKFWDDECHEAYDAMLDECATCETCGGAEALKERDPVAYRCGFADYFDGDVASEFAERQVEYEELWNLVSEAKDVLSDLKYEVESYEKEEVE